MRSSIPNLLSDPLQLHSIFSEYNLTYRKNCQKKSKIVANYCQIILV